MNSPALNVQQVADRMFFIVGCGRSGTSLLTSMVAAHPALTAHNELPFWHAVYRKYQRRLRDMQGEQFVDAVLDRLYCCWWMQDLKVDRQTLRDVCLTVPNPAWHDVYAALLGVLSQREPVRRIGEKSPSNVRYMDLLSRCFPKSQIVHIVRDPRAVFRSFRHVQRLPHQVAPVADRWNNAIDQHLIHGTHLGPDRYLLLRYEDLVEDPQCELERVCRFLGQEYCGEMLTFHDRAQPGFSRYKSQHMSNTLSPISRMNVDRWCEELSSAQIALIEYACADRMRLLGYDTTDNVVTLPRLRLAASRVLGKFLKPTRWFLRRRRAFHIKVEMGRQLQQHPSS